MLVILCLFGIRVWQSFSLLLLFIFKGRPVAAEREPASSISLLKNKTKNPSIVSTPMSFEFLSEPSGLVSDRSVGSSTPEPANPSGQFFDN